MDAEFGPLPVPGFMDDLYLHGLSAIYSSEYRLIRIRANSFMSNPRRGLEKPAEGRRAFQDRMAGPWFHPAGNPPEFEGPTRAFSCGKLYPLKPMRRTGKEFAYVLKSMRR